MKFDLLVFNEMVIHCISKIKVLYFSKKIINRYRLLSIAFLRFFIYKIWSTHTTRKS